jgi:predicted NBD/HSP70 family sugar kinase
MSEMTLIGKPQMLKEVNSSIIERLIYKHGSLSKSKLADMTKLSIPTVNKIVDDLERDGRICSVGMTGEGAGRKAVLYQINKDAGCIIVLYYRGGEYLCRLSDMAGNALYEKQFPLDGSTDKTAMNSTARAIDSMSDHAQSEVKAIGVGVPGAVLSDGKLIGIPQIRVWEGFNLEEALSERYNADIYIENDVKLSTVGYYLTHLSDELDNMVYIYAGNGMGSGIIINKKLCRGSTSFSGELGFMAPLTGEPPQCDYTLEGGYLEKQFNPLINSQKNSIKERRDVDKEVLINLFTAIAANYIVIINPAAIIFGGEAFDESLLAEIRLRLAYYSPKHSIPQILYDDSDKMGIDGLVLACMGSITPMVQLVQDGGV